MKPLIPFACLAAGIAIGWFARPLAGNGSVPVATGKAGSPAASVPGEGPARTASAETSTNDRGTAASRSADRVAKAKTKELDDQTKEAIRKSKQDMSKRMTDMQRKKFEARLTKLIADLNLTPEQQQQLRDSMEKRFAALGGVFGGDFGDDPSKMKEMMDLMKSDGVDSALAGILSGDQPAKYEAVKAKDRQNRAEAKALKDLSNLSTVLDLSPDQRDGVYQALADEAAARAAKKPENSAMGELYEGMGIQIDDELGLQDLMQEQMEKMTSEGGKDFDQASMGATMKEMVKKRTEERISLLTPYLTPAQVQQYQAHLEAKGAGMMGMFGGVEVHEDAGSGNSGK